MRRKLLFILILFLGFILRFINFEGRMTFDADQEYFSFQARKIIIDHKLTLIGIPTQIGPLFIGPLFSYFLTFFLYLSKLDPVGLSYASMIIFFINILITYFVFSQLLNHNCGLLACLIYATAFRFISYSLTTWPIDPLFGLALLFIYSIFKKNYFLSFFSIGLGTHLHVQIYILFIPLLFFLLYDFFQKRLSFSTLFKGILIFLFFISPLIVFSFRHNFLPFTNIINLSFSTPKLDLSEKILTLATIISDSLKSIFFPSLNLKNSLLKNYLGLIFILLAVFSQKKDLVIQKTFLIILLSLVPFFFYHQSISDYYLYLVVPMTLIISVRTIYKFPKLWLIYVFLNFLLTNVYQLKLRQNPYPLSVKRKVVETIIDLTKGQPFAVSYLTSPGLQTGYTYLFTFKQAAYHISTKDNILPVYTLVIPSNSMPLKTDFLIKKEGLDFGVGIILPD